MIVESPLLDDRIADASDDSSAWARFSDSAGSIAIHARLPGQPPSVATAIGDRGLVVFDGEHESVSDVVLLHARVDPGIAVRSSDDSVV